MLFDMLVLFIIVTIILFILICYFLFVENINSKTDDEIAADAKKAHIGNWKIALILIMVNLIFIVLVTYGFYNVEYFHTGVFNATTGLYEPGIYKTDVYYSYSFVFYGFFFIHILLFFKAGYDALQDSLRTKGQIDYNTRY